MSDMSLYAHGTAGGTTSLWRLIADTLAAWGAARACAAALEFGRQPAPADLRRLGIDPVAFARVRLH